MSAADRPFLSIAGRWKQHVTASGIDKVTSRHEQAQAMLMFYAGFAAALEATMEVAGHDEASAMQLLSGLHQESQQVTAMAQRIVAGVTPS